MLCERARNLFSDYCEGVLDEPMLVARIPGGNTRGVAANGRYFYAADRDMGIIVIERED